MVVGASCRRCRADAGREQDGADAAAARARRRAAGVRACSGPAARCSRRSSRPSPPVALGLVEGDDQQAVSLVGGRVQDLRTRSAQELVRRDEAAGLAVDARRVVAVVAEVRGDEGVVGRRLLRPQVGGSAARGRRRCAAQVGAVDDRVEVDERVVAGRVLVADLGRLGVVLRADRRVAAAVVAPGGAVRPCPPCSPSR